jgi:hypothetical protein
MLHLRLIILSVKDNITVDSEAFLMTYFMNLKIKAAQFFRGAHRGRMRVYVFIEMIAHMCMSSCVYIVFLKKLEYIAGTKIRIQYYCALLFLSHYDVHVPGARRFGLRHVPQGI